MNIDDETWDYLVSTHKRIEELEAENAYLSRELQIMRNRCGQTDRVLQKYLDNDPRYKHPPRSKPPETTDDQQP